MEENERLRRQVVEVCRRWNGVGAGDSDAINNEEGVLSESDANICSSSTGSATGDTRLPDDEASDISLKLRRVHRTSFGIADKSPYAVF